MAGAVARWGMVISSSPDLARVVAPASPPATEHARAATERKGTGVTGAMDESNRRTDPSWADLHICRPIDKWICVSSDRVTRKQRSVLDAGRLRHYCARPLARSEHEEMT